MTMLHSGIAIAVIVHPQHLPIFGLEAVNAAHLPQ